MRILRGPLSSVALFGLVASLLTLSCADAPLEPAPDELRLILVSGDAQTADPGTELPDPLVVLVVDSKNNRPVRDQLVNFRVADGGGSLYAGAAITDRDGLAADYWTLGTAGPQVVEARAVLPTGEKLVFATFTATLTSSPPPPPPGDADGDGFTVADGDCDDTDATVHPGAADPVDAALRDANCDGVDGDLANAVLVATDGADTGTCGAPGSPCATVAAGVAQAAAAGGLDVYVAAGTYPESVAVPDGVSIYGGFAADFSDRDPTLHVSAITGSSAGLTLLGEANQAVTLLLEGHAQASEIADLHISGQDAAPASATGGRGGNAYAVAVVSGTGAVVITRNRIQAGSGGAGSPGAAGTSASGVRATAGSAGQPGDEFITACNDTSRGAGGAGAVQGGDQQTAGGSGGAGGTMDTDCSSIFNPDTDATSGLAGQHAAFSSSSGGRGGFGGSPCNAGTAGQHGLAPMDGAPGGGGSGGTATGGTWMGSSGGTGGVGTNGRGGGGGGGAGGCDTFTDSYGAGGGGGGAGGLAAPAGGTGGAAGGASIAVLVHNAAPEIADNEIVRGTGGAGGSGGAGASGQPGGLGGAGGGAGTSDGGPGGRGGDGSRGGHSAGGGGGAGGPAIGVLVVGGGPTIVSNGFTGGAGGAGGPGGVGPGQSGQSAQTGTVQTVVVH